MDRIVAADFVDRQLHLFAVEDGLTVHLVFTESAAHFDNYDALVAAV
jgi:hypothetical protein